MSDYARDAIAATAERVGQGHEFIRSIYARMLPMLADLELIPSTVFADDIGRLIWTPPQ